jgi:hypothetical protein
MSLSVRDKRAALKSCQTWPVRCQHVDSRAQGHQAARTVDENRRAGMEGWTAPGHPSDRRRPSPGSGGAADWLGKVGGLPHCDSTDPRPGRRTDSHRLPAARLDAQPARNDRAVGPERRDRQLDQSRRLGSDLRGHRSGRDRPLVDLTGTAQQPPVPAGGHARPVLRGRSSRHRRGPLHQ